MGLVALTVWQAGRAPALAEAQAAEREHDYLTALRRAVDRLDRAPNDPVASLVAARCLTQLQFVDQAEPYYERAQRAGILKLEDNQKRALGLTMANRLEPASTLYEQILKNDPDNPTALRRFAALRISQARYRDALNLAGRLTQLPGQAVIGYALIGTIEHEQKHADRAVAANKKVLELDPELRQVPVPSTLFWTQFANDLIVSGQPREARRHLKRELALRSDPVQMDLLGSALQWEGELDKAEECYRQAIEWDPNLGPAWLHMGRLLMQPQINKTEEAVTYLKRAVELDPASFEAPYTLSLAYRRLRRKEDADRYQRLAEELKRKGPPTPGGMGEMPDPPR
ncbi:MAG TPA: hypothetical protein VGZ22_27280 [Isosphaeraceae bacterium]|jgi:tetratricopeptide (TPR) repeat protein|nr:hypothetical protein [Isosphaeraceae bacterium]